MKPAANQIICGSNIDVVKPWPANCIDGIVTDPPYGLGFMGKDWDTFKSGYLEKRDSWIGKNPNVSHSPSKIAGKYDLSRNPEFQQWFTVWAKAMLRITKPGGFLLCFGGTRTYHRLTCAIEDAGWEIRDCMMWLYGSGFPKSTNISLQFDKTACRKQLEKKLGRKPTKDEFKKVWESFREKIETKKQSGAKFKLTQEPIDNGGFNDPNRNEFDITAPATNLAQLWDGYGTALKPAWEPIIVAMKPLDGTFAHNAEAHGVAGLNIDGGRIGTENRTTSFMSKNSKDAFNRDDNWEPKKGKTECQGRWPANLVLDEEAGAMLDEQTGISKSPSKTTNYGKHKTQPGAGGTMGDGWDGDKIVQGHGDSGGASRFFYCAKTSRKERNMGMEDCEDKLLARSGGAQGAENRGKKEYLQKHIGLNRVAVVKNNHPTVKPLALMKYLCTLLKMPSADQIILDPFMGSGTTGIACKELGINFIGIEKEQEYCEISVKRIAAVPGQEITLHTETTLPVTKNVETFRTTTDSAGGGRRPNESLPHVSESRQRIIDAASAELHKKRISPAEGLK